MHHTEMKAEKLYSMNQHLMNWLSEEIGHGKTFLDGEEASKTTDMIKDLAEAEEKYWKACYYKKVVEAMEACKKDCEEKEEEELPWYYHILSKAGYDGWRYSSGRYAPKGHGHRSPIHGKMGFMPYDMTDENGNPIYDQDHMAGRMMDGMNPRMGYTMDSNPSMKMMNKEPSKHGRSFDQYREARRHYSESHQKKDKDDMDAYANEHMAGTVSTLREIWKDADPELRNRMKADLTNLMGEMNH